VYQLIIGFEILTYRIGCVDKPVNDADAGFAGAHEEAKTHTG